jgi:hypothetical protein
VLRGRVESHAGVPLRSLQHLPAGQRSHRHIHQRSPRAGQVRAQGPSLSFCFPKNLRMNILDHISESLQIIFGVKNYLIRIRDPEFF